MIEPELLEQIAGVFKVPAAVIRDFDEEATIFNIQNNYDEATGSNGNQNTINYAHKWVEATEEMKKLYERMLKEKDEMIVRFERMMERFEKLLEKK